MQSVLNSTFEIVLYLAIAYLFIGFSFTLFPNDLPPVPPVQFIQSTESVSPVKYATLDWVKVVDDKPTESVNVISLAIPRMKVVDLKAIA